MIATNYNGVAWRIEVGMLVMALLTGACATLSPIPTPTPMPSVHSRDLVLDTDVFPDGWVVGPCEPSCGRDYRDTHSSRTFYREWLPGHVIQDVFRLPDTSAAHAKLELYQATEFAKSRYLPSTEFVAPPSLGYHSPLADEFDVRCGVDSIPACKALIRYGQYFVYFYFDLDSWLWYGLESDGDGLRVTEIESILRALDELVATRFGIPLAKLQASPAPQATAPPTLPPTPPKTTPELIAALSSDDVEVRVGAAYTLALHPTEAQQALPALITNLQHPGPDVRYAAVWAMEAIGAGAQSGVPALSNVLRADTVFDIRNETAIALGKIGDVAAVPALASALYDEELAVQRNAAEAIASLTMEDFPETRSNGDAFDDYGNLIIVLAAREWWMHEGQYRDWSGP